VHRHRQIRSALPVDERAHREVLREPDEGVVDRLVAVRVVLPAHHLADDRRALAEGDTLDSPMSPIVRIRDGQA
jgi:hypothetical protein